MKREPNQNYEQDMDFLLFEYLEGDLKEEASFDLEERLAFDETLQEEIKLWENTYIGQDFYNTEALEKKILLKIPYENKNTTAFYMIGIVLLTSFLSLIPFKVEEANHVTNQPAPFEEKVEIGKKSSFSQKPAEHIEETIINTTEKSSTNNSLKELQILEGRSSNEKISNLTPFDFEDLNIVLDLRMHDALIKPLVIESQQNQAKTENKSEKNHSSFRISRKHQREIERAKEKASQKTREQKFLRGNKPYVVPLSPNF